MNIILVIFDTLRKDCVGIYGSPPWWKVHTPHFDTFASESLVMTNAFPNALPTLPTRIALYTGHQVYPFEEGDIHLKGDFVGAPGWGPIPEEWPTLSEMLQKEGYRTALIADLAHMFKPSKNFWRGFDQWTFLRGQEADPYRSGPHLSQEQLEYWLPEQLLRLERPTPIGMTYDPQELIHFVQQCIMNMHDRTKEEDYFVSKVFQQAARWLEQNRDAEKFFLTIESFDPHEPWLVPSHYRKMYLDQDGQEQVITGYSDVSLFDSALMDRTRANYCGLVSMCDRWFGYFMESMRVLGLLENTLVIFTSDHGHSLGEGNYLGKRGYPSGPEVYELPLMVRFPGAEHAGTTSAIYVQHVDITASILEQAGIPVPDTIDGIPFVENALSGSQGPRDHVTVGWSASPTVINDHWWFNCKFDGSGVLLFDRNTPDPFAKNVADDHQEVVNQLYDIARQDAGGSFPEWLLNLAKMEADAPGCSPIAARG
jgi:arylsulfatase A-like enzyme